MQASEPSCGRHWSRGALFLHALVMRRSRDAVTGALGNPDGMESGCFGRGCMDV